MSSAVRIKVCGVTRSEDVAAAVAAGVDWLGLNFYPPSPRFVAPVRAAELLQEAPLAVERVAVCVDPTPSLVAEVVARVPNLRYLQWHGSPPLPATCPLPLIAAFRVGSLADVEAIRAYCDRCRDQLPAAVLVDAHVAGWHGGTGQRLPWELLVGVDFGVPLILAGGLTPDNVAQAIAQVRPGGVDVASGVESAPGIKDAERIRTFVRAVRSS